MQHPCTQKEGQVEHVPALLRGQAFYDFGQRRKHGIALQLHSTSALVRGPLLHPQRPNYP